MQIKPHAPAAKPATPEQKAEILLSRLEPLLGEVSPKSEISSPLVFFALCVKLDLGCIAP
jgi:hypothetical protein